MKLNELNASIENLDGVGPKTAKLFAKMGIFTCGDLLSTYPRDYDDRTNPSPINQFAVSKVHTICQIIGHSFFGYGRTRTLKIKIKDSTGSASIIAFNRPFLEKQFPPGSIAAVTGKFELKYNEIQCTSFDLEKISDCGNLDDFKNISVPGSKIYPIYPLTEGLSQKVFRKTIQTALKQYCRSIDDEIPEKIIQSRSLMHKKDALEKIHLPLSIQEAQKAKHTLIYEELYIFEYKMAERTARHRGSLPDLDEFLDNYSAPQEQIINVTDEEFKFNLSPNQAKLLDSLKFQLTADQKKVIHQINIDLEKSAMDRNALCNKPESLTANPFSMQRLLQGDVGSGKTMVALFAALRIIDYGGQVAFLAPTEILAKQHANKTADLLQPLGINVAFLSGNLKAKGRNPVLEALKVGSVNIVCGTHALFSTNVNYFNLQLAIIDEQHRFGVSQRESIIAKGRITNNGLTHSPDVLMMSATPIPQTLALTAFGDLDISIIRTMPKGRKTIETHLTKEGNEDAVYRQVAKELEKGHQAYFVYPRIYESDVLPQSDLSQEENCETLNFEDPGKSELKSAQKMFQHLSQNVFTRHKVALIHGKIPEDEQSQILQDFRENKIQVIVATTVVEVGVDVPNATCIVIDNADKFGLAELHQLRGRVGRSSLQSYCFLIYSKNITKTGIDRMKAIYENSDGFVIAEEDLRLRGPGEVLGTQQSGYLQLGISDLARDKDILIQARYDAFLSYKEFSK